MQFFDLNIPYRESDKAISDKSSKKQIRLKQIVKLMEVGYSGIAYNRTIKGVMSESDRCTISPFPLSSLLNASPSLSANVAFHRRLLGVPENCAFRQYSRLTMFVETSAQASVLNSGNPVLKTYDLIAVRPLNQNTFDIACQSSQVDLISIDLEKLQFRLKLPMVKAAIARGVYFEIVYSSLMQDIQVRKQTITNAKLLVEWTRGKNLIVSSSAPSVLELRGPNDVVNLLSLFGLSNEFAKATISKNCRLLITNALRKKKFHKEAIRVEEMPSGKQTDPKEPWIVDHIDWDPLSSGEGDLLLDDMAKAFAECGKVSKTVEGIGFSSIAEVLQSHDLQVNGFKSRTEGMLSTFGNFNGSISSCKENAVSKKTEKPQNETTLCSVLLDLQDNTSEHSQQAVLPDLPVTSTNAEDLRISSSILPQELKNFDALETSTSTDRLCGTEFQSHISIYADNMLFSNSNKGITSKDDDLVVRSIAGSKKEVVTNSGELNRMDSRIGTQIQSCDQSGLSLSTDITLDVSGVSLPEIINDSVADKKVSLCVENVMNLDSFIEKDNSNGFLLGDQQLLEEVDEKKEDHTELNIDSEELIDADAKLVDPLQQAKNSNGILDAKSMHSDDMRECKEPVQEIGETAYRSLWGENKLDKNKLKQRRKGQVLRFPFKRLFQVQFKKNGRNSMYKQLLQVEFKKNGRNSIYKSKERSV